MRDEEAAEADAQYGFARYRSAMAAIFARYGAELYNLLLGLAALVGLGLARLAGVVSFHTWWFGSALSLSFVVLPLALLTAHRLSPRLARSMEITGAEDKVQGTPPATAAENS